MSGNGVSDKDRGYKHTIADLLKLAGKKYVVVGIRGQKGAVRYEKKEGETAEPLTLVEVAAVNEFGSKDGHVPERSFLRSTFDKNKPEYARALTTSVGRVIDTMNSGGDGVAALDRELGLIGLKVAGDVQTMITSDIGPPNAPSTIARKKSTGTLRDTGRLLQSIDSEVRRDP